MSSARTIPPRVFAALVHLGLSAAVALLVLCAIYFYWYPDVLFAGAGGKEAFAAIHRPNSLV